MFQLTTLIMTSASAGPVALDTGHPDRFSDTHLRTLQRRVQQWRGIMAKKLVYTTAGEPMPELPAMRRFRYSDSPADVPDIG